MPAARCSLGAIKDAACCLSPTACSVHPRRSHCARAGATCAREPAATGAGAERSTGQARGRLASAGKAGSGKHRHPGRMAPAQGALRCRAGACGEARQTHARPLIPAATIVPAAICCSTHTMRPPGGAGDRGVQHRERIVAGDRLPAPDAAPGHQRGAGTAQGGGLHDPRRVARPGCAPCV